MPRSKGRDRRGATLVLLTLLLAVLVGMAAFTFEIGRIELVDSELSSAVDAGALAATLKLKQDPGAVDEAAKMARKYVRLNEVGWRGKIGKEKIDVEVGVWDAETRTFVATVDSPTAVRVTATRVKEPFMFARVFGQDTFQITKAAIAAGTGAPLDIMMALDVSGSMEANGRIEALRNSAPVFVDVIESFQSDDRIGVITYSGEDTAYVEAPLTTNYAYLRNSVLIPSELYPAKHGSWTPTGNAIRVAADFLTGDSSARDGVPKVIVLMSDGRANRPSGEGDTYARQMASYAHGLGVKVFTISLGNDADVDLMQSIADLSDAEHFDARGSGEDNLTRALTEAFRRAAAAFKRTLLVQ